MKSKILHTIAVLVSTLGLATGCATTAAPLPVTDMQQIFAARHRNDLFATLPREGKSEEKIALDKPLDADAAVRIALAQNRDLRASLHEVGIAQGALEQAGLLPNPEMDFELRRSHDPAQPLQVDIGIEYDVTRMLLVPLRQGVAEAELTAERLRAAGRVLDTAYAARIGFYTVQARQQELDLRTRALQAFQAGFAAAEELHRVGNLPDVDLATQRAAVESARIDVAETENRLLDARENVNIALGLSGKDTSWPIAGPLANPPDELPDLEDMEKKAVLASFELAEIQARMQAASRKAGLAQTEGTVPHLSGGFHGERDAAAWELGGHITVGIPLFDRNQGRVSSAKSEFSMHRERYVATATALRSLVRTTLNRVESTSRRARHYRNVVLPAREKALAEMVLQYNAMQVSVFQLLDSQRQVTQTAIAYVDTLLDYWIARATLDQILAGRHRDLALGSARSSASSTPASSGSAEPGH